MQYVPYIFVLISFILIIGLGKHYRMEMRRRAAIRNQQQADRAAQKLRDQRFNLGGRIYNALVKAAGENPTKLVVVTKMTENGGRYSIIVRFNEQGVARHEQATFQISLVYTGETGKELQVLEGNYGPNFYYPATEEEVESIIPWLQEKTWKWGVDGHFPKRQQAV